MNYRANVVSVWLAHCMDNYCDSSQTEQTGPYCHQLQQSVASRPTLPASTAFRHLPPNSARFSYATEGTLFISAQLSTDAVSALRKVWVLLTLRAPLSGTFLQTLPDLVTPLKGHFLSPRSCPATRSAPSERFGYCSHSEHRFPAPSSKLCQI